MNDESVRLWLSAAYGALLLAVIALAAWAMFRAIAASPVWVALGDRTVPVPLGAIGAIPCAVVIWKMVHAFEGLLDRLSPDVAVRREAARRSTFEANGEDDVSDITAAVLQRIPSLHVEPRPDSAPALDDAGRPTPNRSFSASGGSAAS